VFGVGNSPEPSPEHFLAERLDFTEGDGAETGPLGREGEAADAGEEVDMREVIHFPSGWLSKLLHMINLPSMADP
jgi:hypothetical protein